MISYEKQNHTKQSLLHEEELMEKETEEFWSVGLKDKTPNGEDDETDDPDGVGDTVGFCEGVFETTWSSNVFLKQVTSNP